MPYVLDEWSLRAVPIEMKCCGHSIGSATGFFWRDGADTYLVTNWHVLSGRHPVTRRPRRPDCAVPDEVLYPRYIKSEVQTLALGLVSASSEAALLSPERLNNEDGAPIWFQHPVHLSKIDVAALKVPAVELKETIKGHQETCVYPAGGVPPNELFPDKEEDTPQSQNWYGPRRDMGDDLFILGFPLGLRPTQHFPIWKRTLVATEMDLLLDDGMPSFLVDTATREGMPGAPVIHVDRSEIDQRLGRTWANRKISFLGIYSGRRIDEQGEASQLGVAMRFLLARSPALISRNCRDLVPPLIRVATFCDRRLLSREGALSNRQGGRIGPYMAPSNPHRRWVEVTFGFTDEVKSHRAVIILATG